MNRNIRHISIPTPCTQNWADLAMAEQGRFCQNCQKTVVDFTGFTNEQIIKTISSSGNVCGRFADGQLESVNAGLTDQTKTSPFWWKKFSVAAAVIGLVPFIKTEAKVKPLVQQGAPDFKKSVVQIADTAKQFRVITGSVTDSLKRTIPGATIRIKGTQFQTATDVNGHFKLLIPTSPDMSGQVVCIGFKITEFKVDQQVNSYSLVLKEMEAMMGEVMIAPVKKTQTSEVKKTDKH